MSFKNVCTTAKILVCCLVCFNIFVLTPAMAEQPAAKIGVMNVQNVLANSNIGKEIKGKIEDKMKDLKKDFKADEDALVALKQEIEKKSSVWSKEVKAEKVRDLQKMQRELKAKTDDANFEMRQLQNKEFEPVFKKLDGIVGDYAKKNGYILILDDVRSGVLYLDNSINLTDVFVEELNKAM